MKRGARQARAQRVCCRRASRVVLAPVTADTLFAQHARLHGPPQQASPQAADQFFVDGLSSQRLLQRGAVRTGDAVILKVQPRERVVVVQRVEQRHHTFNVDGVSSQVQRLEHRAVTALTRSASPSAAAPAVPTRLRPRCRHVSVRFTRRAAPSAAAPSSSMPFKLRPSFVSALFTCSAPANADAPLLPRLLPLMFSSVSVLLVRNASPTAATSACVRQQ